MLKREQCSKESSAHCWLQALFPNLPAFRGCRLQKSFIGGTGSSLETFPVRSTLEGMGSLCLPGPKVTETTWWLPPGLEVTKDFAAQSC